MIVSFYVPTAPAPKGSFRAFTAKRSRRVVVVNDNARTKSFQDAVAVVARGALNALRVSRPSAGPVSLSLLFLLPDPAPKRRRNAPAPGVWERKPDLDKLARSVLDGLTGVLYLDDQQVDSMELGKRWARPGEDPGVDVAAVIE